MFWKQQTQPETTASSQSATDGCLRFRFLQWYECCSNAGYANQSPSCQHILLVIWASQCWIAPFRDVLETTDTVREDCLLRIGHRRLLAISFPPMVSSNGMNVVPVLCQSEPFLPAHIVEYLGFPMSDCTILRCFGNDRHSPRRLPPQNRPLTVACDFVSSNGMNVVPVLCQSEPFLPAHIVEYLGSPVSDCTISRCFGNNRHSPRRLPPHNLPPTVTCDFVSSNGMNVVPVLAVPIRALLANTYCW